jgi:electron transport complex protein RnfD
MNTTLAVTPSPHIRDGTDIKSVMYAVVVALIPATIGSIYFFGVRALVVIVLASVSAVLVEVALQKAIKRKVTITDGSALVTGMLVAFNVPPGVPYWLPVAGSAFAIGIAKIPFGGLGYNPLNPALAARAFLLASWPVYMTAKWVAPSRGSLSGISAITTATPLGVYRYARGLLLNPATAEDASRAQGYLHELYSASSLKNLFFGNVGGCVGETSVLLLLVGAAYLLDVDNGWEGRLHGLSAVSHALGWSHTRSLFHGDRYGDLSDHGQGQADFWGWLWCYHKYN